MAMFLLFSLLCLCRALSCLCYVIDHTTLYSISLLFVYGILQQIEDAERSYCEQANEDAEESSDTDCEIDEEYGICCHL